MAPSLFGQTHGIGADLKIIRQGAGCTCAPWPTLADAVRADAVCILAINTRRRGACSCPVSSRTGDDRQLPAGRSAGFKLVVDGLDLLGLVDGEISNPVFYKIKSVEAEVSDSPLNGGCLNSFPITSFDKESKPEKVKICYAINERVAYLIKRYFSSGDLACDMIDDIVNAS